MNQTIRELKEREYKLKREYALRKARLDFYPYAVTKDPLVYKKDRTYLIEICNTLQAVCEGKIINPSTNKPYRKIMLNMPPRHAKTRSVNLLISWLLGRNQQNRIISSSYNEKLSRRLSRSIRNTIAEDKKDPLKIIFNDIFEGVEIQRGDATAQLWSLKEQYFNFLGTSPNATMTGIGCNIGIIDDLIKDAKEAKNERILEEHWEWYTDTFLSRLEVGSIQIIIGTRWAKRDLFGRLLEIEPDEWLVIEYEAYDEESDKMLCDDILPKEEYKEKKRKISPERFQANYHNTPMDEKGKLYQKEFLTYPDIPRNPKTGVPLFEKILNYTDTADTGKCYFCSITAGLYELQLYPIDIVYTEKDMDHTIKMMADMLYNAYRNFPHLDIDSLIEGNNGGKEFMKLLREYIYKHYKTRHIFLDSFKQTENKEWRVNFYSSKVNHNIIFPDDWKSRWHIFSNDIINYQKSGKKQRMDAVDTLTGLYERIEGSEKIESSHVKIVKPPIIRTIERNKRIPK